jgi:hypothetical protein
MIAQILQSQLDILKAKAQAHDDYLEALRRVRQIEAIYLRDEGDNDFMRGWRAYAGSLAQATVDTVRGRMVENGQ